MSFYNVVLDVLKQDERFFTDDGQLLRNAVYEAAMQMDARLIKALYDMFACCSSHKKARFR